MDLSNVYEYNQHFVAMMNVINAARLNPPAKGHNHHIIPKCWFKLKGLPVDNSKDNLVLLTEAEHMKIHKLASMCILGSEMRSAMGFAVHILHGTFSGMRHTDYTKQKMSKSQKGDNNPMHGKHHSAETRKKMSQARKGKESSRKGATLSEETRRKLSAALKGHKGHVPWNKGKPSNNKGKHWKLVDGRRVWYE